MPTFSITVTYFHLLSEFLKGCCSLALNGCDNHSKLLKFKKSVTVGETFECKLWRPMYRNKRISVYFPCRNESGHLEQVINSIPTFVDEVIVVSNKSTDNTVAHARKLGVQAIEDNRTNGGIGYGYAHMTGIDRATGDIIVAADADGTYPIAQLAEVLDHYIDNDIEFMSCNRHPLLDETTMPFKLRLGVWILNAEVRVLYGRKIHDILSGMWLVSAHVKDHLDLTMGDWNLSPEIKLNALMKKSIKFSEYHIKQHQRHGESHQNHWKTGWSHLRWIARHRVNMLASALRTNGVRRLQSADIEEAM